ncbi:MAG: hypothetical protein PUF50_00400 [Erysipelotrichaceae bacterium]|nr:hypothetical protein [Erysipelotrichaceae bacterium]
MRFLLLIKHVCLGMCSGIKKEVSRLSTLSDLNGRMKETLEDINRGYRELGEYVYQLELRLDEERLKELYEELDHLQGQLLEYQTQLEQIKKDG